MKTLRFYSETKGKHLGLDQNFREFSDTFLTLVALAPLLDGPTKITGIAHTRKQETTGLLAWPVNSPSWGNASSKRKTH